MIVLGSDLACSLFLTRIVRMTRPWCMSLWNTFSDMNSGLKGSMDVLRNWYVARAICGEMSDACSPARCCGAKLRKSCINLPLTRLRLLRLSTANQSNQHTQLHFNHFFCLKKKRKLVTKKLTPDVRLVDDLRLDEFLDDIFKRDEADSLVERIAFSLAVDALHERHVSFAALLELLEDDVQRRVFEDKVTRILVELAQRLERRRILGIDERQLFDEQQSANVGALRFVDGDSRETCKNASAWQLIDFD